MDQTQTAFIEVVRWISQQKDIPLQTRRDFVAHLLKTKSVDKKSRYFIEYHLKNAMGKAQLAEARLAHLSEMLATLIEQQNQPGTNLKQKTVDEAQDLLPSLAEHFTSQFRTRESELVQVAETSATDRDNEEAKALKAKLKQ